MKILFVAVLSALLVKWLLRRKARSEMYRAMNSYVTNLSRSPGAKSFVSNWQPDEADEA